MKKGISNLVLIIILGILVIVYLFIKSFNPFQKSKNLFNIKEGSIVEISINLKYENIIFNKKNDQWVMDNISEYKINEKEVVKLENIITRLTFERIIENQAVDLNIYGLDNPLLMIKIKLKNSIEKTLFIGVETVSKTQYYAVMQQDKKKVFTVSKRYIDLFGKNKNYYRDKSLLNIDLELLSEFELIDNNHLGEEIKLTKTSANKGRWQFVLPVKTKVKSDAFVDLISRLGRLEIEEFLYVSREELEKYGLKKPFYKLVLTDERGNFQEISFGKEINNKIFIKTNPNLSDEVYSISSALFKPQDIKIGDLLDFAPLSVSIDMVNTIIIKYSNDMYEFKRDKNSDIFLLNGKKVDNDDFISLYVNMMSLSAEGFDRIKNINKPYFTIILEQRGEIKKIKVDFIPRTTDTYFLSINDEFPHFYIKQKKLEVIKDWLNKILK